MNLNEFAATRRWEEIAARAKTSVRDRTKVDIRSEDDEMRVRVSGVIDDFYGFSVKDLIAKFDEENPRSIVMLIESPGGSFVDGLALHTEINRLRSEGVKVRAEAVGLVASAATLPYFAASERVAHAGSMFMIHNVWSVFLNMGGADDLEKAAAESVKVMRKMDDRNRAIVAGATGMNPADAATALAAETWYDCDEMVGAGICSEIIEPPDNAAKNEFQDPSMEAARSLWREFKARRNSQKGVT